jgi:hypothetical protein
MAGRGIGLEKDSFAAYCFDNLPISDLYEKLGNKPDAAELAQWDISKEQWLEQLQLAIKMIKKD